MRTPFSAIINSRLPRLVGTCATDTESIAQYVNDATRRLVQAGGNNGWWGTWDRLLLTATRAEPYITLPARYARLVGMNVCKMPQRIQNEWYEMLEAGIGLKPNECQLFDVTGAMEGIDRNVVPTQVDLSGTNKVRVYATNASDYGKRILIQGNDQNGLPIYSYDAVSGTTVEGFYLTLAAPYAESSFTLTKITGIQKDVTLGDVLLYEVPLVSTPAGVIDWSQFDAYWRFEAPTAQNEDDATGNGHILVDQNSANTSVVGKVGQGKECSGNGFSTPAFPLSGSFSVHLWVNESSAAGNRLFFDNQWTDSATANGMTLVSTPVFKLGRLVVVTNLGGVALTSAHAIGDGNWHRVYAGYDATSNSLFIKVDNNATETQALALGEAPLNVPGNNLYVGGDPNDATNHFVGIVDETAIKYGVLSDDDVLTLWNGGLGIAWNTQENIITDGTPVLLARFAPYETTPTYRRYYLNKLPCKCPCAVTGDPIQITAIAKLEFYPVTNPTDWLLIGNVEAVIEECQAIRLEMMDNPNALAMAEMHHNKAIALLNKELTHYIGNMQPAVNFSPFGTGTRDYKGIGRLI